MAFKTREIRIAYSAVQTFYEGEENQNTKKMMAFLAAENENRQLDDLRQTDLAVYLKDFFFR